MFKTMSILHEDKFYATINSLSRDPMLCHNLAFNNHPVLWLNPVYWFHQFCSRPSFMTRSGLSTSPIFDFRSSFMTRSGLLTLPILFKIQFYDVTQSPSFVYKWTLTFVRLSFWDNIKLSVPWLGLHRRRQATWNNRRRSRPTANVSLRGLGRCYKSHHKINKISFNNIFRLFLSDLSY